MCTGTPVDMMTYTAANDCAFANVYKPFAIILVGVSVLSTPLPNLMNSSGLMRMESGLTRTLSLSV